MVQATIFNEQIRKFNDVLENGKTYIIWNTTVKPVNKTSDNINNRIELTFTDATELEEIDEQIPYNKRNPYVNFNNFEKISKGERLMVKLLEFRGA